MPNNAIVAGKSRRCAVNVCIGDHSKVGKSAWPRHDERVSESGSDPQLLKAMRSLRSDIASVILPLQIEGASAARKDQTDLITQLDDYILPRLADLEAPLLAVVGGSTGAGKSTLVNSLAGRVVSRSGVLRPTTRAPVLVHHQHDARWFTTPRILPNLSRISGGEGVHDDPGSVRLVTSDGLPPGVAVLDAPDIDSVVAQNRNLARQLLHAADLWIFVTSAARYADAVPWTILREAAAKGTSVAIVLDRVPPEALEIIGDDLTQMLIDEGLRHAPVFTLPECILDEHGLLPEEHVAPLREWLTRLADDARARGVVVRRTLSGALQAMDAQVMELAEASSAQVQTVEQLQAIVTLAYAQAVDEVSAGVSDGSVLRGEVLARWQEYVGTGQFLKSVEVKVGRLRDRLSAALQGKPAPGADLGEALQSGVAALIQSHAESARLNIVRRWRAVPGGAELLAAHSEVLGPSPEFEEQVNRLVRDWQGSILDLVRHEGKDRRTTARVMAFGVNAVGVVLMLVVFSQTMGLSGGEVGIAGGSAALAQRLLEAVFGDQAVRTLAERSRRMLIEATRALYHEDRARLMELLSHVNLDPDAPDRLREAAALVRSGR